MVSKEDLDKQILETERKLKELKEKETGGFEANGLSPEDKYDKQPGVEKASEVLTPEGNQRGLIVLWDDGYVTTLLGDELGHGSAYTTSHKEGIRVYFMSLAWAASLGHKIKPITID